MFETTQLVCLGTSKPMRIRKGDLGNFVNFFYPIKKKLGREATIF